MGALLPLVGRFGPLHNQTRQQMNVVKKESRGRTSPAETGHYARAVGDDISHSRSVRL